MNEVNILSRTVWLIPFLPLLASLWIGIGYISATNRGESGEKQTSLIANGAALLSLLIVLAVDLHALLTGIPGQLQLADWFSSGDYRIMLSFTLDTFGLVMMTLVAVIAVIMMKFSVNYMHREAGYQRFFMILSLFTGAMLLIVMSGNAVLTFTGWELAGVSSYLLIAYAYDRPVATRNATRVFITNRIGDAGFIIAIYLYFHWLNSVEWSAMTQANVLTPLASSAIAGCFLIAALAKSSQGPFAPWISRALEGPTPSSAIFYGSLMVHAGVYLVIRLQPVLEQTPVIMAVMAVMGLLTALYGFFSGLVQTDVKSSLIFSTTAHVGLMFFSCGLGWFELAAWYLVLHALWRAYQFLHAPSLMHFMGRTARPVSPLLQRCNWLYTASLQRFWLDQAADWILTRPVNKLVNDAHQFDEKVVNRLVGTPEESTIINAFVTPEQDTNRSGEDMSNKNQVTRGHGVAGKFMQWLADSLYWFEEHLVLQTGNDGLLRLLDKLRHHVLQIEQLLSQPRYLVLMVLITFVVII